MSIVSNLLNIKCNLEDHAGILFKKRRWCYWKSILVSKCQCFSNGDHIYGKRCKTSLEYLNTQWETMQNDSSWDQTLCIVFLGETIASVTDTTFFQLILVDWVFANQRNSLDLLPSASSSLLHDATFHSLRWHTFTLLGFFTQLSASQPVSL